MSTSTYDQLAPFYQLSQVEPGSSSVFVPETLHVPDTLHERVDEYVELRMSRKFQAADIKRGLEWMFGWLDSWVEIDPPGLTYKTWIPEITFKFIGFDRKKRPVAFVICSPKSDPGAVSRNLRKAEEARRALGPLGDLILTPFEAGELDDLTFATFRYCYPLGSDSRVVRFIQRASLTRRLLAWLRHAAAATLAVPTADERGEYFTTPLQYIADSAEMPGFLRDAALAALGRLDDGLWNPRLHLMHNDFGTQNVLMSGGKLRPKQHVIIDWERSSVRGYGFYDLYTMSCSLGLGGEHLAAEIRAHCGILGCEPADVGGYLLALMGRKAMLLNGFAWSRFSNRPQEIVQKLSSVPCRHRRDLLDIALIWEDLSGLVAFGDRANQ